MNLHRSKLFPFYLVLSATNGVVPFVIVLVLSVSVIYAVAIWALATAATYILVSLVCLRTASGRMQVQHQAMSMPVMSSKKSLLFANQQSVLANEDARHNHHDVFVAAARQSGT
jgi:hypothetical protein